MQDHQRKNKQLTETDSGRTLGQNGLPLEFRMASVERIQEVLTEQIQLLPDDPSLEPVERARTGYLYGILLRAIEAGDLTSRLEALERIRRDRSAK